MYAPIENVVPEAVNDIVCTKECGIRTVIFLVVLLVVLEVFNETINLFRVTHLLLIFIDEGLLKIRLFFV